ncbi:MAG: calcineurin-like phosphoesterase family protein [Bacteroidia bacterium]|nr:calcineurin-like phosphoesterase family protein [Bacteroidia bacterium]
MRKIKKADFVLKLATIFVIIGVGISFNSCNNDNKVDDKLLKITGVSIPSSLDIVADGEITLTGKGFEVGDLIVFTLKGDAGTEYTSTVTSVTASTVTFTLPDGISSGIYTISVERGDESLALGTVTINVLANLDIPDISGMTVKGVVYCDGYGLPGVVVSDGFEVSTTDASGIYYLPSQKKNGYVFISVPGNYEVSSSNNIPQFFKRLTGGSSVEQKDFSLYHADNSKHVVLTMADWHLANRNDDLSQFSSGFLADVNSLISSYKAAGTKVYGLTLGDMTWDLYWYENNYALPQYLVQMNMINCTMFNIMGNHDNDPYCAGDLPAEAKFRTYIGPTYYSFNLGSVHYIVLDDIQYINTSGAQGVIGDRDYYDIITSDQMIWLSKDLATLTDKSKPVIIAIHAALYKNPSLDANGNQLNTIDLLNGSSLISTLQGFTNVHILSGHTHINFTAEQSISLMEHNTAAVCATWWWTGKSGYAGNQICKDGSPGGYGVWEINGTDVRWYYKSIGKDKNYQFRSYDRNQVLITAANFAPNSTDAALAPYAGVYASPGTSNEVLLNVWGYDPGWKIEVKEGSTNLAVERIYAMDPLHIISYEAKRLNAGAIPTSSFVTCNTAHLFRVTAANPASTLDIKVTDHFGNVYSETMSRPKIFTYLMQ